MFRWAAIALFSCPSAARRMIADRWASRTDTFFPRLSANSAPWSLAVSSMVTALLMPQGSTVVIRYKTYGGLH